MKKTWKQIEDSRNRRLWITNVIIPIGMIGATVYANSAEVREGVNQGFKKACRKVKQTKAKIVAICKNS